MKSLLLVGLGGAAGAMGRYLISLLPVKTAFPLLTLLTNLLGAVLIGFVVGASALHGGHEKWVLFWKTGVCGGFTTFSTFSLEALRLFQTGQSLLGGLYVVVSVALCMIGVALGQYAAARCFR